MSDSGTQWQVGVPVTALLEPGLGYGLQAQPCPFLQKSRRDQGPCLGELCCHLSGLRVDGALALCSTAAANPVLFSFSFFFLFSLSFGSGSKVTKS